ncbi:hypothetical protein CPC08DRAFT_714353 [Agrocybe pediades]|nr:hypothetical protein CPC08DRAFT_714353 [Agrocybe pediades]
MSMMVPASTSDINQSTLTNLTRKLQVKIQEPQEPPREHPLRPPSQRQQKQNASHHRRGASSIPHIRQRPPEHPYSIQEAQ